VRPAEGIGPTALQQRDLRPTPDASSVTPGRDSFKRRLHSAQFLDVTRSSEPTRRTVCSRREDRGQLTRDLLPPTVATDPDDQGAELAALALAAVTATERQEGSLTTFIPWAPSPAVIFRRNGATGFSAYRSQSVFGIKEPVPS